MVLLSAFEDFVTRTLAQIPSPLGKLEYLSTLRKGNAYEHWGLTRVHGEIASQQALSDAHKEVWLKVLRTPLRKLLAEVEQGGMTAGELTADYVRRLRDSEATLMPLELAGGSARHFNSVLAALLALCQARQDATRPAA